MFRSQRIHHHLNRLSKINTILAVSSLLAVLGLYAWVWNAQRAVENTPTTTVTAPVVDEAALEADYRSAVNTAVANLDLTDSAAAESASFAVLEIAVPAAYKTFHLELVLALSDASTGDSSEARTRMTDLADDYDWFVPAL